MNVYLVGGAVRDEILGLDVHERDYVVVGETAESMKALGYRSVGKDFPVFLHPETSEEYALARKERKTGPGHQGFDTDANASVTLEEDLVRRDLTINAIAKDSNGDLIDPCGGQSDIENRLLKHVSPAFSEDPLRVLRVARFLARFHHLGFTVHPETFDLMRAMVERGELSELTPERVLQEVNKALVTPDPGQFFELLRKLGTNEEWWPEISDESVKALASLKTEDSETRFARLLLNNSADEIDRLCKRLRCPKDRQQLSQLVAAHHRAWQALKNMEAKEIVDLLYTLDAIRHPARFNSFNDVCETIFNSGLASGWQQVAELVSSIKARDLDTGATGPALGEALKQAQILAVREQLNIR